MVQHNVQNPTIALRYVIYNELSQTSRNPNNMALILMLFQTAPEVAPKALAGVFQELLTRKEDFLRALRGLFREIVRVLRHEMDFSAFCLSLLEIDQQSPVNHDEHGIKEWLCY
jgi:integrator complex subunit 1